jgi:hypothetical protein
MANDPETKNLTPLSMHPDSLTTPRSVDGGKSILPMGEPIKDSPALGEATKALKRMLDDISLIDQAIVSTRQQHGVVTGLQKEPVRLPPDVARDLVANIKARALRTAQAVDGHMTVVADSIAKVEGNISKAIDNPDRTATAAAVESDIRLYLRSLPENKRREKALDAVAKGNLQVTAAVLRSPWAAGLDETDAALVRSEAVKQFAKEDHGKLVALKEVHAHLTLQARNYAERVNHMTPAVPLDPSAKAREALKGAA